MYRFTIYCTEKQTKKALKLGAHLIEHPFEASIIKANEKMFPNLININEKYYMIPTAEQMIGWLESNLSEIMVTKGVDWWIYKIIVDKDTRIEEPIMFMSREEATIAAINTALNYLLINNEK